MFTHELYHQLNLTILLVFSAILKQGMFKGKRFILYTFAIKQDYMELNCKMQCIKLDFNDPTHVDNDFQSNLLHSSRFELTKHKDKAISSLDIS